MTERKLPFTGWTLTPAGVKQPTFTRKDDIWGGEQWWRAIGGACYRESEIFDTERAAWEAFAARVKAQRERLAKQAEKLVKHEAKLAAALARLNSEGAQ